VTNDHPGTNSAFTGVKVPLNQILDFFILDFFNKAASALQLAIFKLMHLLKHLLEIWNLRQPGRTKFYHIQSL
jgi:hypothetical protein